MEPSVKIHHHASPIPQRNQSTCVIVWHQARYRQTRMYLQEYIVNLRQRHFVPPKAFIHTVPTEANVVSW